MFVSYSSKDIEVAARVKSLLEAADATVYVAEYTLSPGEDLAAAIESSIRECDLFILLWSTNAKASEWVPQEIGIAKALHKPTIPVLLSTGVTPPGFLRGLKYLPADADPKRALTWLQTNVAANIKRKQEQLTWVGIAGVVIWLLSQRK